MHEFMQNTVMRHASCVMQITHTLTQPRYPNPTLGISGTTVTSVGTALIGMRESERFWTEEIILKFVGYENKCRVEMVVGSLYRLWSQTTHLPFFSLFKKNSSRKLFKMAIAGNRIKVYYFIVIVQLFFKPNSEINR